MSDWQPIESAPKDGTPVDLWLGNAEFPDRLTDATYRKSSDSEWWVHGGDSIDNPDAEYWFCGFGWPLVGDNVPTHWMPRPTPPSA